MFSMAAATKVLVGHRNCVAHASICILLLAIYYKYLNYVAVAKNRVWVSPHFMWFWCYMFRVCNNFIYATPCTRYVEWGAALFVRICGLRTRNTTLCWLRLCQKTSASSDGWIQCDCDDLEQYKKTGKQPTQGICVVSSTSGVISILVGLAVHLKCIFQKCLLIYTHLAV